MFHGCRSLCASTLKVHVKTYLKCMSTLSRADIRQKRSTLFEQEKRRQHATIGRIEKIEVKYHSALDEVTLVMNRDISTPYDCARHISEGVSKMSALALVNGKPWDMHKPLNSDCEVQLVTLKSPSTGAVNYAFWRTCSILLGAVADSVFKDDVNIHLHSFPYPDIKSGSFVYDVVLDLPDWQPTDSELRALSASFVKLINKELLIERLETTEDVALKMFEDNPYKSEQIPNIAKDNDNIVTLYRVGDHVDISKGPMASSTYVVGRCTVASVHKTQIEDTPVYRFQGVALPRGLILNHFAYSILENRAKQLNKTLWMPQQLFEDNEQHVTLAAKN